MYLTNDYTIDASQYGNFGCYANHSHDPNCYTCKVVDAGVPRLLIFAKREIPANKEITIDYNMDITDDD